MPVDCIALSIFAMRSSTSAPDVPRTTIASFGARVQECARLLDAAPRCRNQQEAHDQLLHAWIQANLHLGVPRHFLRRLIAGSYSAENGWQGIGTRVATWETVGDAPFRIFLHDDGAMVIQYGPQAHLRLIYSKPGASRLPAR